MRASSTVPLNPLAVRRSMILVLIIRIRFAVLRSLALIEAVSCSRSWASRVVDMATIMYHGSVGPAVGDRGARDAAAERGVCAEDVGRSLGLRVVADAGQVVDLAARAQLAEPRDDVLAAHRIEVAVDQRDGDLAVDDRGDPALAMAPPLAHVADDAVVVANAVGGARALPEPVELGLGGLGVGAEHVGQAAAEALAAGQPRDEEPDRAVEQLLHRPWVVSLGKDTAVERQTDAISTEPPRPRRRSSSRASSSCATV